jgi:hypothetical protein
MTPSKAVGSAAKSKAGVQKHLHPTLGFGVPATSDPHHFRVSIPSNPTGQVHISEYLGMQVAANESAVIDRVLLDRTRWTAIRSEVQRAFNAQLNGHSLKPSTWKVGDNLVDRLLGKEICVLAWAVEKMELEKIPVAVRNWLALRPEERRWLYGMTAMCTGGINDGDKGWRVALLHALGDVAQNDLLQHKARRQRTGDETGRPTLDLFGNE